MTNKQDYRQLIADLRTCASYKVPCKYCSRIIGDDCAPELKSAAADAIETLLKGIEAYRQAAHREWVSVEKRLPDNPKDGEPPTKYNVVIDFSGIRYEDGSRLEDEVDTLYFYDDEFRNNHGLVISVTHWMPLPEPPEV